MGEVKEAYSLIKKGFTKAIPNGLMRSMTPDLLQRVIEGDGDLTVEKIKKITRYSSCDDSMEEVKRFWRVLGTFDNR